MLPPLSYRDGVGVYTVDETLFTLGKHANEVAQLCPAAWSDAAGWMQSLQFTRSEKCFIFIKPHKSH